MIDEALAMARKALTGWLAARVTRAAGIPERTALRKAPTWAGEAALPVTMRSPGGKKTHRTSNGKYLLIISGCGMRPA